MQKKLIALAIAGLAAVPAFAQNNVQIYGVIDASAESIGARDAANRPTTDNAGVANAGGTLVTNNNFVAKNANDDLNATYRSRVASNSSYIGFRGTEAVGNGMQVIWQVENQIMLDSNANNQTLAAVGTHNANHGWATREAFGGLVTPWGTVKAGYQNNPSYAFGAGYDIYPGATGVSTIFGLAGRSLNHYSAVGTAAGSVTTAYAANGYGNVFDGRNQWIKYESPRFSGFGIVAQYQPNETKSGDNANTAAVVGAYVKRNNYAWGGILDYVNGGFKAGIMHHVVHDANQLGVATGIAGFTAAHDGLNSQDKLTRIGMRYNWGAFELSGMYEWLRLSTSAIDAAGVAANMDVTQDRTGFYMGARYTTGQHNFRMSFGKNNDGSCSQTGVASCSTEAQSAFLWSAGYNYALSKRTDLYLRYTHLNNDTNARYDFGSGQYAMGGTYFGTGAAGAQFFGNGADPTAFSAGLRHSF